MNMQLLLDQLRRLIERSVLRRIIEDYASEVSDQLLLLSWREVEDGVHV